MATMNRGDWTTGQAFPGGTRASASALPTPGSAEPTPAPAQQLVPPLSLPKGGGAIRGVGEKYRTNTVTGSPSLTIPIFTSPGRSGFGPELSLSYQQGAGNGPFGLAWTLSVPSITRKTEKGLPRYNDANESDTFILSDAEDLVPALKLSGTEWVTDSYLSGQFTVQGYCPREEGLFARIEWWRNTTTDETYWQSITKDNVTSVYGRSADRRIADPTDAGRVFKWLLEETSDDKGNVVSYEYKAEDLANVDPSAPQEAQRLNGLSPVANAYLKRIFYGNTTPFTPGNWLFQVVLDYGEHDGANPTPRETQPWPCRLDAFSTYRAGFRRGEMRSYRLCCSVLLFHQFAELGADPCLVRSTDFQYDENPIATQLTAVTWTGYLRDQDGAPYQTLSLPPLALGYTQAAVDETIHTVDAASIENLPAGLDHIRYQWIDLDSEGVAGVLTEQAGAWYYKRNLGSGQFAPLEVVATLPSLANLNGGRQQVMDLAGDGQKCLVQFSKPVPGYFERNSQQQWDAFIPFASCPNVNWNDPNLRLIDLDGDGFADILITDDAAFTWYPSLATEGFGPAEMVPVSHDDSKGPALVFADGTESIYLADMSGDGLTDLVRIRDGEVRCWPSLGFGCFGAPVVMDGAPVFDYPDQFEQKRIRLADIDGSGATDIVYLGAQAITFWLNQSGNSWSVPHTLVSFPPLDDLSSVQVMDLLGNGTACLVWSSPLPAAASRPLQYIDLMSGQKPYLLQTITNNLGAQTRFQYAASTKFYLADRAAGRPWITTIPFPVPVVEQVEMRDAVSGSKLVSQYAYHDGYYDGDEREFRGFGLVEQWDTQAFEDYVGAGLFDTGPQGMEAGLHLPPIHTETWYHTGVYRDRENISQHFAADYYAGDPQATLLPDTQLPPGLTAIEEREACRTLKGRMLRQEVYADDGTAQSGEPYSVSERTYQLRLVQPQLDNPHAVVYACEQEALEYHYERNPADPRISHTVTLEVDPYGNVTKSAAVGYARRTPAYPEQGQLLITYTEADVINTPDAPSSYRHSLPAETRTYEVSDLAPAGTRFALAELAGAIAGASEIPFEAAPTPGTPQKRLFKRSRTLYYTDDLSASLTVGQAGTRALPYGTYSMAFTPGLVTQVCGSRVDATLLAGDGKYLFQDGAWWAPSGRRIFDPARFYLPVQAIDPFGNSTSIAYDSYALLVTQTTDPLGNVVQAAYDYRNLLPAQVTGANGNRSAASFDALGQVVATALMGKVGAGEGDTLSDPTTRVEYNLFNWVKTGSPNFVHASARERHGPTNPRWQESYAYSDGFGRVIQTKVQAAPGLAPARDASGVLLAGTQTDTTPNVRWVGTGRTIFDNKDNPVKQYEPFFSPTPDYETEPELVQWGVTPVLRYDPLGRLVRTDFPDGSYSTVEFDPWQQTTRDRNDTVVLTDAATGAVTQSRWYADRQGLPATSPDARAAQLALAHANTPTVACQDTLGRTFLIIADNGGAVTYATHLTLDIAGNQRSLSDARLNQALASDFDMLRRPLHTASPDAGERWLLADVAGKPLRGWDSRGFATRHTYDPLRRPARLYVQQGATPENLAELLVYGEAHPSAVALNLRGRVYQGYDGAGCATSQQYDFKGNLLSSSRQLAAEYHVQVDWSALSGLTDVTQIASAAAPLLEGETFTASTAYDALNRPTSLTAPDGSETQPIYDEASLLKQVNVRLRGAATWTPFVTAIEYNARGQREWIAYGNGARTDDTYDPYTFRLTRLLTTRSSDSATLQDLVYTYDPVGNITEMRDSAQQMVFFKNAMVSPSAQYQYDPLYRLTQASGREHVALAAGAPVAEVDLPLQDIPDLEDSLALQTYTESYTYDPVGNILQVAHRAGSGGWTRSYAYASDGNRLLSTSAGAYSATYAYDAHGNMTQMPHLPAMGWDFKNELQAVNLGGGGTVYYVYDASGRRVRKVWEKTASLVVERIYLGAYEIYRERSLSSVTLERQTLHVMDDTRRIAMAETLTVDAGTPVATPTPMLRYQFGNHLDSACLELDGSGAVISYEEYYPYGASSYRAARSSGVQVSARRYRYTGKERDDETSLYYCGARYYAAWLGRWTSCDPGGMVDGVNLYRYARNNPLALNDPSGWGGENKTEYFVPHQVSGKESIEEIHELVRKTGYDFEGKPIWKGKQWVVGEVHPISPPRAGTLTHDKRGTGGTAGSHTGSTHTGKGGTGTGGSSGGTGGPGTTRTTWEEYAHEVAQMGAISQFQDPEQTAAGGGVKGGIPGGLGLFGDLGLGSLGQIAFGLTAIASTFGLDIPSLAKGVAEKIFEVKAATTLETNIAERVEGEIAAEVMEGITPLQTGSGFTRSEEEANAMAFARVEYELTGSRSAGGMLGHEAQGAAPHGVDVTGFGESLQKELKYTFGQDIPNRTLRDARIQTFGRTDRFGSIIEPGYSLNYQLKWGRVPIRMVKVFNPMTGAWKLGF